MNIEDLVDAVVATLAVAALMGELDVFAAQMEQERRMSNHARFEGTWVPHEATRRQLDGPAAERHTIET